VDPIARPPTSPGVWADGEDEAAARSELQGALEGGIALGLALGHPFPALDGVENRVALAG
jgi:predicted RNase H-like HicB family nuclease